MMRCDDTRVLRARRAALMTPGREVIEDAAVAVRAGVVVEAGTWASLAGRHPGPVTDLGEVTLLPGLVNAHTHLELSHVGLPPETGKGFLAWVRWLVAQPVAQADEASLASAVAQLEACGTAGVADISSRNTAMVAEALERAGIRAALQFERFGHMPDSPLPDVDHSRLHLAGHALYSTAPESLRAAKAWDSKRGRVFSIHLAEHPDEAEFLATGRGDFADFLRARILPPDFAHPGLSAVAWAEALGLLDQRTLAVHSVCVSKTDIEILKNRGSSVCLCPRSNAVIGVGAAPARALLDAGVPCCLGTDSLASCPDLDLFAELEALLARTPMTLAEAVGLLSANAAALYGFPGLGRVSPGSPARFAVLPHRLEQALRD